MPRCRRTQFEPVHHEFGAMVVREHCRTLLCCQLPVARTLCAPAAHCGEDVFNSQLNRSRICRILSARHYINYMQILIHKRRHTRRQTQRANLCVCALCLYSIDARSHTLPKPKIDFSCSEFFLFVRFISFHSSVLIPPNFSISLSPAFAPPFPFGSLRHYVVCLK